MSLNDTIADLYVRKGQAQAAGALGAGQAWGSALSNIGQTVGKALADVPAQQELAKQRSDTDRARAARNALSQAMKDTPPIDNNGLKLTDVPSITQRLTDAGFGAEASAAVPHLQGINDALNTFQQARIGVLKTGAAAIAASGFDAGMTQDFLEHVVKPNQVYGADTVDKWSQQIKDDPSKAKAIVSYILGPQKAEPVAADTRLVNPITNEVVVPSQPKPGEGKAVVNGQVVNLETGAPIGAPIPKQVTPLTKEEAALKDAQLKEINAKLSGAVPMSEKDKQELALQRDRLAAEIIHWRAQDVDAAPTLTPEALKLTAHQYAMTGQLPPMGMGKAGAKLRTEIINQAADEYKGLDLPSQMAAYKANQASLVRTQGTLDNLTAFEKAAGKNIDTFIDLAKNLPDSGVPWINTPIRLLSDKMVGDKYLPAINAARQIATREVARVVNDPGLKGELTDSARKGVDAMMGGDITVAQLKEVLPVLKQDMANVHSSLGEQLGDIQKRIATPPGGISVGGTAPVSKVPETVLPGFSVSSTPKK